MEPGDCPSRLDGRLRRTPLVHQFVDVVAKPSAEMVYVEPSCSSGRNLNGLHVQAEIGRNHMFPRDHVILARLYCLTAAGALVDYQRHL
jgi:hypothetical protein